MNHEKDFIGKDKPIITDNITPKDLLVFAKLILFTLSILFVFGGIADMFKPEIHIFESCKTILPPISTLVIGYYFGKN